MHFVATYTNLLINTKADNRNKDLMHLTLTLILTLRIIIKHIKICTFFFFNKKDVILVPNDHSHSRSKINYTEYKIGL